MTPATEKAPVSVEPGSAVLHASVERWQNAEMPPGVSTGDRDTVVGQVDYTGVRTTE